MTKFKKYTLLGIIAVVLIAGSTGYYFYNKGPVNVKNASAKSISASELYAAFLSDSVRSREIYCNKIWKVSGTVIQVSKNVQNQVIVMLETSETGAFVNCTMEEETPGLQENSQVVIKGICTGMGMGDPDLGILGDVYITRCYLNS